MPDDGPRLGWFERYTEARQGPEQIDKVSQTFKVGDGAALDLSHLSGDIRVTTGSASEIRIDATKRARHRNPEEAKRVKGGDKKVVGFLVGQVMKATRGSADGRRVRELLLEKLGS